MKNSSMNARNADSNSMIEHEFLWKWYLSDLEKVSKNGYTVFSCFSCGGGSTMGYKLAGYTVFGNCEIDPDMIKIYRGNHHPKHSYLMDIRDFSRIPDNEIPVELKNLDILDGSPPCSVFSTAGDREKGWNTEKVFREGQKKQRLDDLFFWFIEVARKLQPKVVIAENVKGILLGNAKGYVNEILKAFDAAGYVVQIFKLNAATMGVPQKRERVFFIAHRKDLEYPKLKLSFSEKPILFGEVRSENGKDVGGKDSKFLKKYKRMDRYVSWIEERETGIKIGNYRPIIRDDELSFTITASGQFYRADDLKAYSDLDYMNVSTFPQDYDFMGQSIQYVCGMSVPPVMMAHISKEIQRQWFDKR